MMGTHGLAVKRGGMFLAGVAGIAALIAVPLALAEGEDDYDLDGTTPHSTFIENGMDPVLMGTWKVLQVQIEQGGKVMVFPNSGAMISILDSGSFKQDYSSETNGPRATDIAVGDLISPTIQSPVATCKMVETGEIIGDLSAHWDDEPGAMDAPEIHVMVNMAASTRPEVRCAGSDKVIGNMVTPALGMGRVAGMDDGQPYVAYAYMIDRDNFGDAPPNDFRDLEIWSVSADPVRIRYYLRKVE